MAVQSYEQTFHNLGSSPQAVFAHRRTSPQSEQLSPNANQATDYKQVQPGKGLLVDKSPGFATIEPISEFQARSTYAGEGFAPSRKPRNNPYSYDGESQITITQPGVIEDLIEQSEKRVEQKLMKRLLSLSENSEQNVSELYQNLQKKLDANK